MNASTKILVTGATGFVGSNLVPLMRERGLQPITPGRKDYDLLEQAQVRRMLADIQPDMVIHLAALVGGILGNKERPADYHYQNAFLGEVMLHESFRAGVKKYVTVMGGCSYPADAPNPIKETSLFYGYPQQLTAPYSLAKAMNAVQAAAYREQYGFNAIVLVPGNMYGPHDNFDLQNSHVLPALIRKFVDARKAGASSVSVWGTGSPKREFLFVDDLADAVVYLMNHYDDGEIINIGTGKDISILELATLIKEEVGYNGTIELDSTKPDGTPRKLLDVSKINGLGWTANTPLREGIRKTIQWYLENR